MRPVLQVGELSVGGGQGRGEVGGLTAGFAADGAGMSSRVDPCAGHWYFGANDEYEFNWLPAVPQGKVHATYSVAGKSSTAQGVGYQTTTGAMPRCSP